MGCGYHKSKQLDLEKPTLMGEHLQSPADVKTFPQFPKGTKSLLSKCLTPEVWSLLKDRMEPSGFTFKHAIFSGCKYTESGVGVYAGSHQSYYRFEPLFDKII